MSFKQAFAKAAHPLMFAWAIVVFVVLVVGGGTWWRDAAGVAVSLVFVIAVRLVLKYGQPYDPSNKRSQDGS